MGAGTSNANWKGHVSGPHLYGGIPRNGNMQYGWEVLPQVMSKIRSSLAASRNCLVWFRNHLSGLSGIVIPECLREAGNREKNRRLKLQVEILQYF
jgi:hypothetical protein